MSNIAKPIQFKFTGASTNDPVTIQNQTTREVVNTFKGNILRLETKNKSIVFDVQNFVSGWTVGDVIIASVGGTKTGNASVTLTAQTGAPQVGTATAATSSTTVLNI